MIVDLFTVFFMADLPVAHCRMTIVGLSDLHVRLVWVKCKLSNVRFGWIDIKR